ncbi:hypothetical protein Tsubulata_038003 [Turnera subulata]|uniref:Uncharacterized protein n=1 Tax=Turnera subulata TaxID=218843 RepID=A0A9Q0F5T5_9ROSI|nr:hypothetical protein Tsubulata_038003 [Turnera subulata]
MINAKKLIKIARKWQRLAALKRKRISLPRSQADANRRSTNGMSQEAEKGHFVVYSEDQTRFMLPLSYLNNPIFREILAMSEDEFGLPSNGPITLPCDVALIEYVTSLIRGRLDKAIEKALIMSIPVTHATNQLISVHGLSVYNDLIPLHSSQIKILISSLQYIDLLVVSVSHQNSVTMISPKKLIKIARKWQRLAALRRKRISLPRSVAEADFIREDMPPKVEKGHFVFYTADQKRFALPLSYLNSHIFRELLDMSEEEFGLPSNGPITLPCDAAFIEYAVSLVKRLVDQEMEKALAISMANTRCSLSYCHQEHSMQQLLCSF